MKKLEKGVTNPKKDKKEKKDSFKKRKKGKRKIFFKWECFSFLPRSCRF